jgi:lysophospholipase L1-like esterase
MNCRRVILRKLTGWVICLVLCFLVFEVSSQLAFRIQRGGWYWKLRRASSASLIQPHPYFAAFRVPNRFVEHNGIRITINSFGCRGPKFKRPKPPVLTRIVALGGSTTFCVGVSDNETWEFVLNERLGPGYEVINMGGAGSTSLEASLQTALLFSDVQPDVALYYLGWNDARVQHVKGLRPDWSDSHGQWVMAYARDARALNERFAGSYLLKRVAYHYFFPALDYNVLWSRLQGDEDKLTDKIDQRALQLYERNLRNIVALCQKQGVKVVFIPQILNYKVLTSDKPYGFLPFVRDRDLRHYMDAYNETLAKTATDERVGFAEQVIKVDFQQSDFIDNGHFSPKGNRKFAAALEASLNSVLHVSRSQ